MEKNVEEMAMKKDRHIEQLKSQMVAATHQFQQKFNDRVSEGMKEKEKELRAMYVTITPNPCMSECFSAQGFWCRDVRT